MWSKTRLKPHRLDRYMASNDPAFEQKVGDIALYMDPPQHAAVFCVDEKTAIQALDRLDPVLPLSPGGAERHCFEYYRHGTLSLYAALDVQTGKFRARPRSGTRVTNSSLSSIRWSPARALRRRSISCWTISLPTKRQPSLHSLNAIPASVSTSSPLTPPGSTRSRSGSPKPARRRRTRRVHVCH